MSEEQPEGRRLAWCERRAWTLGSVDTGERGGRSRDAGISKTSAKTLDFDPPSDGKSLEF